MKKGAFAPRSSLFGPDGPLARHWGAGFLPGVRAARLAGGRGALRQRLGSLLVQMGPLAAAALLRRRLAHVAHGALEPLGLLGDGIDRAAYRAAFGGEVTAHLPELEELFARELARAVGGRVVLTAAGVERSDAIGPFLVSAAVRERMASYELR